MTNFCGRCLLKKYIPSKQRKYGIKLWVICNSKTSYVLNMQVYTGKQPESAREQLQEERMMLDLIQGLDFVGKIFLLLLKYTFLFVYYSRVQYYM